jgi:hypothetical protein
MMEERAVRYAMHILRAATDWQEAQHALANHPVLGPWLEEGGDPVMDCQRVIREAEDRLGQ